MTALNIENEISVGIEFEMFGRPGRVANDAQQQRKDTTPFLRGLKDQINSYAEYCRVELRDPESSDQLDVWVIEEENLGREELEEGYHQLSKIGPKVLTFRFRVGVSSIGNASESIKLAMQYKPIDLTSSRRDGRPLEFCTARI